ncbi:hypothetical protein OPV22_002467 [Ensete ventricosum]|uniref:Uncharacterized protein n=1 Tax=Ensete ventricosum TaxID=4639 RepID=A0AAV8RY27_ENSVE|nr:hypothetical protein OPV22_002467 [Ensete ventricosum]
MPAAEALAPEFCKYALGDGTATRNACCSSARALNLHLKSALVADICTWRRDGHSQCLLQKRSRLKSANLHCATAAAALLLLQRSSSGGTAGHSLASAF